MMCFLIMVSSADAGVTWHRVGASVFGSECDGSGSTGYKGDNLDERSKQWSFAELGMGQAMGGLPYKTRIRILDPRTGRRTDIYKRDIGAGGGDVEGEPRDIDLYYPVAHWVAGADCNWTGVIDWRLDPIKEKKWRHASQSQFKDTSLMLALRRSTSMHHSMRW